MHKVLRIKCFSEKLNIKKQQVTVFIKSNIIIDATFYVIYFKINILWGIRAVTTNYLWNTN